MSGYFTNPFAGNASEEQGLMDEACGAISLTRTQRFYGFGICFVCGFLFSILGTIMFFFNNITGFAILYTFGNVMSLSSTAFLVGPVKQCKNMFDKVRWIATILVFLFMALTLIFALVLRSPAAIVFVLCQYCAMVWYSASYVPYARAMIKKCCGNLTGGF